MYGFEGSKFMWQTVNFLIAFALPIGLAVWLVVKGKL